MFNQQLITNIMNKSELIENVVKFKAGAELDGAVN